MSRGCRIDSPPTVESYRERAKEKKPGTNALTFLDLSPQRCRYICGQQETIQCRQHDKRWLQFKWIIGGVPDTR